MPCPLPLFTAGSLEAAKRGGLVGNTKLRLLCEAATCYNRICPWPTAQEYAEMAKTKGVARILGKGVLEYACKERAQNFKPRPLINRQGRSSNCQRERVLNVASELAQAFRPNLGMR